MATNRRDKIRMSDDEMWTFIEEQKSLQVATIGQDGMPHLSTLWFARYEGDIVFETYTKSQKIRNLERDPRITVLLEDGIVYDKLRGVMMQGTAELHTDPEAVHARAHRGDGPQPARHRPRDAQQGGRAHGPQAHRRRGQAGEDHQLGSHQARRLVLESGARRPGGACAHTL